MKKKVSLNDKAMKTTIFFILILFLVSCEKQENEPEISNELSGNWYDTVIARPMGYHLYELKLRNDFTFTSKLSMYGIYNQNANELSAYFEWSGNYAVKSNRLILTSHKYTWWDSFYVGSQPKTEIKDDIIYDNCTFIVKGNTLELNYISYPADAPVNTTKQYQRVVDL